jgi:chromosome segregation ATPase
MSEVNNTNKYLDFSGLKKYDALIKAFIASEDSKLSAAIDALVAKIGNLEFEGSDDKTLAEIVEGIYGSIAEIVEKQDSLDAKDAELADKIAEEIAKIVGDEESLEDGVSVMTLVEVANKLKAIDGSITKNTEDIAKVSERVSSLEKTIEDLGAIEGGENLATIVSKVNDNAVAIETLNGDENTIGSVKKVANDAAAAAAATALDDAKAYADGLVKDSDGNSLFDEAGAAAAAQAAAEATAAADATSKANAAQAAAEATAAADATSKANAAQAAAEATAAADATSKANAAQAAAEQMATDLNTAMDERVKVLEAIDHEQLAAEASAAAVAEIVAGADSDFDTLKEVADWILSDTTGAAGLQTTVSNHTESINTINGELDALEIKVDEDIANLTTHMTEAATALGEVDGRLDALEAFKDSHETITEEEINGLFA